VNAARGVVVWMAGLPSAGKSTLARVVAERLAAGDNRPCLLDGDEIRAALTPAPGYDDNARADFYSTLANIAALLARQGHVVLVAATAHQRTFRERARAVAPAFIEVLVEVSPSEAVRRDAKGLYQKVRAGELRGLPGADLNFEAPEAPDVVARGGLDTEAVDRIIEEIERIRSDG